MPDPMSEPSVEEVALIQRLIEEWKAGGPWLVVTGNPVTGFEFVGPFPTPDACADWAEQLDDDEWWLASLAKPAYREAADEPQEDDRAPRD